MGFEKSGDNVVPIGKAHEIRQQKGTEDSNEHREDFLTVLDGYVKKWDVLSGKFKEISDEAGVPDEDKVIVRRQIEMNEKEKIRILFTMSRYRSYEEYKEKIEKILRIFRTFDGETRNRANRSLQDMSLQLDDFLSVFNDYGFEGESAKVRELKDQIFQGFLKG